jgi:hypothetical protein
MALGYSNGIFEMVQLPTFDSLQALSVSKERVTSLAFNRTGDWVAGEQSVSKEGVTSLAFNHTGDWVAGELIL